MVTHWSADEKISMLLQIVKDNSEANSSEQIVPKNICVMKRKFKDLSNDEIKQMEINIFGNDMSTLLCDDKEVCTSCFGNEFCALSLPRMPLCKLYDGDIYCIQAANKTLGYLNINILNDKYARMTCVCVAKQHRSQKFGHEMLQKVLQHLRQTGIQQVEFSIFQDTFHEKRMQFYERQKFAIKHIQTTKFYKTYVYNLNDTKSSI